MTISTTPIQNFFRILLGSFLIFAGITHLTFNRTEFLAQVPNWLPLDPDLIVLLSGALEIVLGLSLISIVKQRRKVGIIVSIFFVIIFPGNISQYVNKIDAFGLNTDGLRLVRLFFQPILIIWALWSCGLFTNYLNNKDEKNV